MIDEGFLEVCLFTVRYFPAYAGPSIRFKRYAPGLATRGIRMSVLAADLDGSRSAETGRTPPGLPPPEMVDGVPVRRVRIRSKRDREVQVALARGLWSYCRLAQPLDLVQMLSLSTWTVPWLLRLRRAGVPLVFTRTMVRDPSASAYKQLHRLLAYSLMDCVVVSTAVMKETLRQEGIRGRIEVIPNGLDLDRFSPVKSRGERDALKRKLGFEDGSELIVFVGGFLQERKGIDVLADAWRALAPTRPQARLILIGPSSDPHRGSDPQARFLARVVASLDASGASDRVVFTGAISNVEDYLRIADVFVFPSRREGMPNVVPEAFGCGAPTIMTPFVGRPAEFGRPGEHYILSSRQPRALAAAICGLLEQPALAESLSLAARSWVEKELDLELSLDRYAALYRELVGRGGLIDRRRLSLLRWGEGEMTPGGS